MPDGPEKVWHPHLTIPIWTSSNRQPQRRPDAHQPDTERLAQQRVLHHIRGMRSGFDRADVVAFRLPISQRQEDAVLQELIADFHMRGGFEVSSSRIHAARKSKGGEEARTPMLHSRSQTSCRLTLVVCQLPTSFASPHLGGCAAFFAHADASAVGGCATRHHFYTPLPHVSKTRPAAGPPVACSKFRSCVTQSRTVCAGWHVLREMIIYGVLCRHRATKLSKTVSLTKHNDISQT